MSRTKKTLLWTVALTLVCGLTYVVLVFGDYAIDKYLTYLDADFEYSTTAAIIEERREKEDLPQRAVAIAEGFHSVLKPAIVETSKPLQALAEQLGVAPLAPHPKTGLYLCNEGYGLVKYTSDRFGFRNPDNAWDASTDLVLIGDSFVQGDCVAEEYTLSGILRDRLNVLSLGTGGNHPVHYAALIKTFLPEIKPRWAGLVFYANDSSEGSKNSLYYNLYFKKEPNYFDHSDGNIQISKTVTDFYEQSFPVFKGATRNEKDESQKRKKRIAMEHFRLHNIIILAKQVYAASPFDRGLRFSSKLAIDTLIETCKEYGCEPIVIYLPNSPYWRPDPRGKNYARALCEYAKRRDIKCKDTTEALAPIGQEAYAIKGLHFSPEGYKIVADQIAQLLKD